MDDLPSGAMHLASAKCQVEGTVVVESVPHLRFIYQLKSYLSISGFYFN